MTKLYISKEDSPLYGKKGYPLRQDEYELLPEKHKYIFKICSLNDFHNAFMIRRNFKGKSKGTDLDTMGEPATTTATTTIMDLSVPMDTSTEPSF